MHRPRAELLVLVMTLGACAGAGVLTPPLELPPDVIRLGEDSSCHADDIATALACYAPIVLQELQPGAARLDIPTPLDSDSSGALADDLDSLQARADDTAPTRGVTFYTAASADSARTYLFYGLYYPADWSGDARTPKIDHLGDFEGAMVVVGRSSAAVEAVITQAHKIFYLWSAAPVHSLADRVPRAFSGAVALAGTHPVLFSESGGHGLYAFGRGTWIPRGGRRYAAGPAAVPASRLLRIAVSPGNQQLAICGGEGQEGVEGAGDVGETSSDLPDEVPPNLILAAELRSLEELRDFLAADELTFGGLPRGATPPWRWYDRRHRTVLGPGRLLRDPAGFYQILLHARRP